jgi:hypothetical protein
MLCSLLLAYGGDWGSVVGDYIVARLVIIWGHELDVTSGDGLPALTDI